MPRAHSNAGTFGWLGAGTRWHDDGAPLAEAGRGGTHALLELVAGCSSVGSRIIGTRALCGVASC